MKQFSEETRRRMSEAAKKRIRRCTALPTDVIRHMYIYEGMTQEEIAKKFGVSQKVIWRHMRNYGIKTRVAAKRDQRGSRNHMWKGKEASYKAFHQRLKENRGEARSYGCSVCGTTSKDESYDWANLTGDYSNLNDFAPMCRKCHRQYDMARKKVA